MQSRASLLSLVNLCQNRDRTNHMDFPPTGHVTLGQTCQADGFAAAREAADQARRRQPMAEPGWALAFSGGQHDPAELLRGFRAVLGAIPIIGGCGTGLITAAGATLTGYECGILLFPATLMPARIVVADRLDEDECAAGRRLGAALREAPPQSVMLLFYDSIKSSPPPVLHIASQLLDGIYAGLGEYRPILIGAGTLADMILHRSYVFDGQSARCHVAVAVALPTALTAHVTITHGCFPSSDFLEITRIEGPRVLELNGQPALSLVAERLAMTREALAAQQPLVALALGEKHGDPFSPFAEDQYVNRLVIAADLADDALILFEADFQSGSRVQLMAYDPRQMIESARAQTQALLGGLGDQPPLFGLYLDCAGRSMAFSGLDEDETAPVRAQVGRRCPLLGFYSGVEIAPFLGRSRPLDWTGVLVLFTWTD